MKTEMQTLQMRPSPYAGKLFTFCGLDGCGKTTMIHRLEQELSADYPVCLTKQPTDSVRTSSIFRTYMDSPDHSAFDYRSLSLLAASDRVQHVSKVIEPMLRKGAVVLSDRYFYSCLANLRARGYYEDYWIYEIAESILQPDVAFFFDLPVDQAVERVRSRPEERERYIDMELQYRLREEYLAICKANNGILVPTTIPEEESYEIVKKAIMVEL